MMIGKVSGNSRGFGACRRHMLAIFMTLTVLLVWGASPTIAQTITGAIRGTVTDPSGAVVSGAKVTATNVGTGVSNSTTSDRSGLYNIQFLPIGSYTVTASAPGFDTSKIGPFSLQIDQTVKINAKLNVGKSATTVAVASDTSPVLQTQDATMGTTITANTLANLPMNGLNVTTATILLPGAVLTTPAALGGSDATERDTSSAAVPSFNGNRQQVNNYVLDGVEVNETLNNLIGYNPAPDSLQQMRVITGNANAEYGNVNGGEVIMVTKGGTNKFHGSVYEYFQNDSLAANTWANNFSGAAKSVFSQNQYGATIGGPIIKNKLFFFGDYEGVRFNTSGPGVASVATAKMRTGDFSQVLAVQGIQLYNTQNGFTPYPNNHIPIQSPVARFLFANPSLYPLPNKTPTDGLDQNNYLGTFKAITRNNQGDVRVDYTASPKDNVMARYSIGDPYDDTTKPILDIFFPSSNDYPFQSFVTNWVHTFSPSLINEFRAGYSRVRWIQGEPTDPSGQFGLKGDQKVGIPLPNQAYNGFSGMFFSTAESNVGNPAVVTSFVDNTFDYGDDLTWEHGNHITKFGVQVLRYQQNSFYPGNQGVLGLFAYGGQFTGNPLLTSTGNKLASGYGFADFVLDDSDFAGIGGVAGPTGQRQYRDAAYMQDDWKVRPNLTLNLGLRYGYDQPIYEVHNKEVNVNLADPSLGKAGLEFAGKNGNSRALYNPFYYEFMPRIGFAWQPNPREVVRGAYGITDDLEGTGANLRLTENPPFLKSFIANASSPTATSGGTPLKVQNGFATAPGNVAVSNTFYRAWAKNLRPALVQQFNLTTQYLVTNQTSVQLGYVGEIGQHLVVPEQANQWPSPCSGKKCTNAPFYNLVGQYGAILVTQSEGIETYNALQAVLQHQQSNGLMYTINYTWSKSLTNNPGFYGVPGVAGTSPFWQNLYDPRADYGPSGYDTRNAINATAVYQLPFGRQAKFGANWNKLTNEALGGWSISGDAVLYSGFPVTINSPNNANVNSYGSRANQYLQLRLKHQTVQDWFGTDPSAKPCSGTFNGTCAYGPELPNTFGTAHVGTERAPGYRQIDLSAFKAFQIHNSTLVQFRADAFNAFNMASYGAPNSYVTSGNFGQITSTLSPPRQLQLSADFQF